LLWRAMFWNLNKDWRNHNEHDLQERKGTF
jgi:hypothetical protein